MLKSVVWKRGADMAVIRCKTPLGFPTSVGPYSHTSHDKLSQRTDL